ncbi:MAG: response regulator transcription factor [Oscillospiraceae bacterium]|jgi:DNA-binding response OmpR family regulator|nr:response regulator transcription factor [Oscillospiraceae bacterium]
MNNKPTILIVDDEKLLVKGIKFNLENDGYECLTAQDGEEAVEIAGKNTLSLIIMDLMMPKLDGLEACRKIRKFSSVPIIMLTAKVEDNDILTGFDSGTDDYLTKPFNILELKARVKSLLRRAATEVNSSTIQHHGISLGHITIILSRRAAFKNGESVELAAKEFDLLSTLMKNPGHVFSRKQLMELVWGSPEQADIRTVDVHIRRLREKLELDPANPTRIMTKWKAGYYFQD